MAENIESRRKRQRKPKEGEITLQKFGVENASMSLKTDIRNTIRSALATIDYRIVETGERLRKPDRFTDAELESRKVYLEVMEHVSTGLSMLLKKKEITKSDLVEKMLRHGSKHVSAEVINTIWDEIDKFNKMPVPKKNY